MVKKSRCWKCAKDLSDDRRVACNASDIVPMIKLADDFAPFAEVVTGGIPVKRRANADGVDQVIFQCRYCGAHNQFSCDV